MGLRRRPTGVPENRAQCIMSSPAIITWILSSGLQSEMPAGPAGSAGLGQRRHQNMPSIINDHHFSIFIVASSHADCTAGNQVRVQQSILPAYLADVLVERSL
jgi:hypothetical protein